MQIRQVALILVAVVAIVASDLRAQQDVGNIPQQVIASTRPLSQQQIDLIRAYVDRWTKPLLTGTPDEVMRARDELLRPVSGPAAATSAIFLRHYSDAALPELAKAVQGDEPLRAINAIIVVRALRTPEAVTFLLQRLDPRTEQRVPIRIRAASLVADTILESDLPPAQLDSAIREISNAAERETNWLALTHDIETLSRIVVKPELPEASLNLALNGQVRALAAAVDRVNKAQQADELMHGISRSLIIIRDQFSRMPVSQQRPFRLKLAPVLVSINKAAAAQWESANASETFRKSYGDAVSNAELLLKLADGAIATNLRQSWLDRNRTQFESDLRKWEDALQRPPFSG